MAILGPFIPSAGLNTLTSVMTLPQNQASVMSDMYPVQGSLNNFGSTTLLNVSALNSGGRVVSLGYYFDPATLIALNFRYPIVIAVVSDASNGKIYSGIYNSSAITFTDITNAFSLPNIPNPFTFDTLNGVLIGAGSSVNGVVPFQITAYNGNVSALAGSPPLGDCVKVVNNLCFIAGQYNATANISTVTWSAYSDPQTWPAASFLTFRNNDGDMITALASLGQNLLIFKRRSVGLLSTTSQVVAGAVTLGPLTTISTSYGCIGANCARELPDGRVAFLDSRLHLIITDGYGFLDVSDQPSGPNIRDLYKTVGSYFPFLATFSIVVLPQKDQIWVHLQQFGIYVYNYVENSWSLSILNGGANFSRCLVNFGQAQSDSVPSHILLGGQNGFVYEADGSGGPSNMDGTTIQPIVSTSINLPFDFIPRTLLIPATLQSGASLTVTVGFNGTLNSSPSTQISATSGALWNLFDIRSTQMTIPRPLTIQVQIQVTAGKTFTIYPIYVADEILSNVS